MPEINITNSAGRDAVVSLESVRIPLKVRWVDEKGRPANSVRVLAEPIELSCHSLLKKYDDLEKLSEALIESDPEVDMELTGVLLRDTSRVWVNPDSEMVRRVSLFEVVRNPDGSERERRPRKVLEGNVAGETPLKWSGKFIDKEKAKRKFVFAGKQQLVHVNGLTYDFLHSMAKDLEERNAFMLVGAGPKANQPLVLRRGSSPYRGFLEGRTDGDRYCLMLHFTNMELKAPEDDEDGNE